MVRFTRISFFFLLFATFANAQSKFGLEMRFSKDINFNLCKVDGTRYGFFYDALYTNERNAFSSSKSIGLFYKMNDRNLFKIHVSGHEKAQIYDIAEIKNRDFVLTSYKITKDTTITFSFTQFTPSFEFNILHKRTRIPIEIGFSLNRSSYQNEDIFEALSYDLRLSSGLHYLVSPVFNVGVNLVCTSAVSSYFNSVELGSYLPLQIGVEFAARYYFFKQD